MSDAGTANEVAAPVLPIAHRAPASRADAERLVAAGARMIEVDVQLRPDGQVVVSHYLPLCTPRWVGRSPAVPLQRDNWRLRRGPGHDPLLVEVLDRIPAGCGVLLDPKHHAGFSATALRAAVLAVVAGTGRDVGGFAVSTSDPELLDGYRSAGLRGWRSIGDRSALRRMVDQGAAPLDGVSIRHTLLDAETVCALARRTAMIVAWTVNSVPRASRLVRAGVTGITTDRPAVLDAMRSVAR